MVHSTPTLTGEWMHRIVQLLDRRPRNQNDSAETRSIVCCIDPVTTVGSYVIHRWNANAFTSHTWDRPCCHGGRPNSKRNRTEDSTKLFAKGWLSSSDRPMTTLIVTQWVDKVNRRFLLHWPTLTLQFSYRLGPKNKPIVRVFMKMHYRIKIVP